ncbi:M48 family metalloprotease [Lacibacter sp. H375]|uniref:M48 family metalloprotease n=1 Tax=Lacibacter sp. H375 TaxID=3133424 RepID=UPI0030BFCE53
MSQLSALYPVNPVNVDESVTEPSASFKSEVKKVMGSISLFFIVYIILMVAAVALAVGCVLLGWAVILNAGHLLVIIGGAGIMSIGVMVVIFLVKFIFSVKKVDESGMVEVTEKEQPELFAFIRQLTIDTQTQFPKKIVLSPEVNASVFYNDSFWSMFFPVKKNLMIGLGLVNTITLSEFKAVMAHEFGHFSQRSMKLGSFVYNVNKAIYNMLYENNDFGKFLHTWGNLHWAIGIFVWITVQIIKGIQSILQGMYSFINKNYMSLSREMEFHADAVAASVSGSYNLATALKKLEISDACYTSVLQKADAWLKNKEVFANVYSNHRVVMHQYAVDYDLPVQNGVPLVSDEFLKRFQLSKLNIKNQWASHPANEDREARLNELKIDGVTDERSAWVLFAHPEKLQQQLSQVIYVSVPEEMKQKMIDENAFREKYINEIQSFRLPEEFNGYYDDKRINDVDLEALVNKPYEQEVSKENFKALFSDEKVGLGKQMLANESDAALLQAIVDGGIETKTFDYDGVKHEREEAETILEMLKQEIEQQKKQLQLDEEENMAFFFKAAKQNGEQAAGRLKQMYTEHFENRKRADKHFETAQQVVNTLSPLLQGQQVSIEAAEQMASELRQASADLRLLLGYWLDNGVFDANAELKAKAAHFVNANYQYFGGDSFIDYELTTIHKLVNDVVEELALIQFKSFKSILEYQYDLYLKAVA